MTAHRAITVTVVLLPASVTCVVTGLVGDWQWLSLVALALLAPPGWLLRTATAQPARPRRSPLPPSPERTQT